MISLQGARTSLHLYSSGLLLALSPEQCQVRQTGASVLAIRSGVGPASMALVDYEVQRLQRIASNRKRMEEMGIFAVRNISIAIA